MIKKIMKMTLVLALSLSLVLSLVSCGNEEGYKPQTKAQAIPEGLLVSEGVLKIGVDGLNNSPFAGVLNGEMIGLDIDIAAAVADSLGLKLEVVDVGSEVDVPIKNATVDIVMGVKKSHESNFASFVSDPYIQGATTFFSLNEGAALPAVGTPTKIAAQASSTSAWEVTKNYGKESLVTASTLKEAFDMLARGDVDFVVSELVIGLYALQSLDVDMYPIGVLTAGQGYSFAIAKEKADLLGYISQAFSDNKAGGMFAKIESKWLGAPVNIESLPVALNPAPEAAPVEEPPVEEPPAEKSPEEKAPADA